MMLACVLKQCVEVLFFVFCFFEQVIIWLVKLERKEMLISFAISDSRYGKGNQHESLGLLLAVRRNKRFLKKRERKGPQQLIMSAPQNSSIH